jgi:TRAP-type uncharacterized transport system substrate-binding protein
VVAYTTTEMDENTAYELTRTYWEQKANMGKDSAWWNAVSQALMVNIKGKIHPGAVKYYQEAGFTLSANQM